MDTCLCCYEKLGKDSYAILSCSCRLCLACYQELLQQQLRPDGSLKYDQTLRCQCPNPIPVVLSQSTRLDCDKTTNHRLSLHKAQETVNSIGRLIKQINGNLTNIKDHQRHILAKTLKKLNYFQYLSVEMKQARAEELVQQLLVINSAKIKDLKLQLSNLTHLDSIYQNILSRQDPTIWYRPDFLNFTDRTIKTARSVYKDNCRLHQIFIYMELAPVSLDRIGFIGLEYVDNSLNSKGGYIQRGNINSNYFQLKLIDSLANTRLQLLWRGCFSDIYFTKIIAPYQARQWNMFFVEQTRHTITYNDCRYDLDPTGANLFDDGKVKPEWAADWNGSWHRRFNVSYQWPSLEYISIETLYYRDLGERIELRPRHGYCFFNTKYNSQADESGWYQWGVKVAEV